MKKTADLYLTILGCWVALFSTALATSYLQIEDTVNGAVVPGILTVITLIFIGYFWLNGTKDILYVIWYYFIVKPKYRTAPLFDLKDEPHIILVYCTRNDFNANSLEQSMKQNYHNFETVILDDSDHEAYRDQINEFAFSHSMKVIRRNDRIGFKAGNLNNFLKNAEYDFFVILDSDEIIPANFIRRMLDYFYCDQSVGIVQGNHEATRNATFFQKKFAIGVNSHWPVYQSVKDKCGFMSLLGHGAMVSKSCYDATGGFPLVVAEDICFSLVAREAGFKTIFAPDILCQEEFPIDYLAFRKRHNKWTQGNMEFIKRNTGMIFTSHQLKWYEKLDIVLFTYSLPLTAAFSLFIIINVIALPLMHASIQYPLWTLIPTILFLVAPMLNDVIYHWKNMNKLSLLSYSGGSMLLYGSMYLTSLRASIKSMFGSSIFLVTPKDTKNIAFSEALYLAKWELLFSFFLVAIAVVCTDSALPVILLALPAMSTPYLVVRHQPNRKENETEDFFTIDRN